MMIEQATVVAYENGIATVQCYAKSGCGGCSAEAACGTKSLSALAGEKHAPRFHLAVTDKLNVGDTIQLGLPEQTLLLGVFWLYCLPLFTLILSAVVLSWLIGNELLVALGVFGATGCTFWLVKRGLAIRQKRVFEPVYLGKASFKRA